jgi:hypothetical protein
MLSRVTILGNESLCASFPLLRLVDRRAQKLETRVTVRLEDGEKDKIEVLVVSVGIR